MSLVLFYRKKHYAYYNLCVTVDKYILSPFLPLSEILLLDIGTVPALCYLIVYHFIPNIVNELPY
jgi:hypothetical protein